MEIALKELKNYAGLVLVEKETNEIFFTLKIITNLGTITACP